VQYVLAVQLIATISNANSRHAAGSFRISFSYALRRRYTSNATRTPLNNKNDTPPLAATVVDHVKRYGLNLDVFYDGANLQSLRKLRHDHTTATRDRRARLADNADACTPDAESKQVPEHIQAHRLLR
jgi:hypothetical protein